ncbi:MAG TPA: dienelactone hydrolase family protein [Acidobacteriaceae bacterium]|nr:dienelactone hydrolase family protein [Acidobacteriaceae bacterium]
MFLRGLAASIFLWWVLPLLAQPVPVEYATFMSHGKAISCTVFEAHDAVATIILLRGSGPTDLSLARSQGRFFADHGFRVLLADYLSATPSAAPTPANYRRWAQVVDDIAAELRSRPLPRNRKIALIGQSLGAPVAILAGSRKTGIDAIAEWSGVLPNEFFSQVQNLPPLLIIHGEQDEQVPIVNARQLVRLCELKDFTCEAGLYPDEGHLFSNKAIDAANQRTLTFFRTYLWANLPKRAE